MKKRYIFIVITIILAIVIQVLSVNITPALKKIADKEINRFCQMVINNTPFPVTLDHQELIKINRNGDEIATINFNTSYASSIGAKMDNSFYQRRFQKMSDEGGVIASIPIGALTQNPFLAGVGPKIKLKYETISAITCSVEKDVKSYGVNHVMVSLKLVIKIKMMVLLPFYNEEFNKDYDYPLVMEIIEGEVPNWYQN